MNRSVQMLSIASVLMAMCAVRLPAEEPSVGIPFKDSFENGADAPEGWKQGAPVRGVKYVYDKMIASDGKRSLSLQKTENRFFPIAEWSRRFKHSTGNASLQVSAKVKAAKASKAIIDVQFLDAGGQVSNHEWAVYIGQKEDNDPVATHDWKSYDGTVEIPAGTKQIVIALQIYGPGKVWFDELDIHYADADSNGAAKTNAPAKTSETKAPQVKSAGPTPIEVQMASGGVAEYLSIPAGEGVAKPKSGYPLLLVFPGGDGSADFHPFITAIHKQALQGKFVVVQPLAPPQIVWPTKWSTSRWRSTEESVAAIIADVCNRQPIDREQIYALAWSSSGPAVYATFLQDQSPFAGALIAMSVFKPDQLPPLKNAAGRRVYLLHSPEDSTCPYGMAKDAEQQLAAAGVATKLVDYAGGHGWHGAVHDNIRAGMQWLQERPAR